MKRAIVLLVLVAAVFAAGCGAGKGAAEMAIQAAQTAFDATKDKAMQVAPEQTKAIQDQIDAAKANVTAGNFQAAMDSAKAIPGRVKELADGLAAKQQELTAAWDNMKDLPQSVDALKAQVEKLAKMKKLPAGIDAAKLDAAKSSLATITTTWGEAQSAFQAGNYAEAVAKGGEVSKAVGDAMTSIGMTPPAPAAPTQQ